MQRLNRWLGIFLTFVLTMSVLCLNVWATDPAENVEDQALAVAEANVAKVGNTEYATIDEAIAAWTNNTTLTLLSDVTLSDVITLKSTEHHILNLGTYTMTAASGKNAFVIKACGTGSAERSAITINADATNPGGINAGNKCVVYYKYADGGISAEDRPIIQINGGVFTGSTSSLGTAGIYTIGTEARKCATLNISGGTFNCAINGSGKSKLIISGGTFNYSVGSQGDSTALRLISGGTFKTFGFMTNGPSNNGDQKLTVGNSKNNFDNGVYVDDNGYLVVGGPVITEAGDTFEASSPNYSGWSSYLKYSSAATSGLYYTSVEEALADNNKATGSVTVYVDELDMAGINYKGTIVVPEGKTLKITNAPEGLKTEGNAKIVKPVANIGNQGYYSLADAIEAAQDGDTITILADISYDSVEVVEVDKNITITGSATLNNVGINANGADSLTISGLKFTGNSWINSGTAEELTVSGVTANVTPSNASYTNSRSAFISLGRTEGQELALTVENCNIVSLGGSDPVLGWAQIKSANITGNTFGSADAHQNNSDSIKIMSIADGAVFNFTGNTVYSDYNGIVLYQNTSRDNSYTATFDGNTFVGVADHIWIELSTKNTYHGNINAKSNNTINGNPVTVDDIKTYNDNGVTGYAGIDVLLNSEGKVIGGKMKFAAEGTIADGYELDAETGEVVENIPVAKIGEQGYYTLEEAFAAAQDGETIVLLADVTPALKSQRAITKAAVIDLNGTTLTLTEDDLYFGTTTFKNGTIVVDPSVKASTAVFWMFANQTLTFDNVKLVATGVTGTYLIGLDGNNSDLNLINGSEILVENTTALDLDIICVNASTGNDIVVENSKVNVTNLDGRVFFRGNYTVKGTSEISLDGITKAGFRIEAGQTLSIEDTAKVTVTGTPRDGGIHLTDVTATYTKADTATVDATLNKPVASVNGTPYTTIAAAIAAAQNGETVTILAGEYAPIDISNKNITIQGTVGANGELLTTIKGGNPAITGHGFNGTIKDLKIVDAWKVMYAEPAGNVTVDNVYVSGATYGFHLVAYSQGLTWTIQNSYMDLAWANSFGIYGGDADIVIKGNKFESTNPYYPDYGALHVNSFLPSVTVEGNVFGENAKIYIDKSVTDTSKVKVSGNYHADGVDNAFADDADGVKVYINEYYADKEMTNLVKRYAQIGNVFYETIEAALAAAQAGDEVVLLADVNGNVTVPADIIFNGNGKQITGTLYLMGDVTFKGYTKANAFDFENVGTEINIPVGATFELTGTGRMIIGHGCTFNIEGTITDAKTADKATLTPSLIMPGASFTGAGVTFNVTNAYIKAPSSYCSSSKSASGTFDFNITNSIVETAGKLAFEAQSTAATVNFELKDSVLTTGSHLVFGVSRGEIVIDNSNVNVGKSNQIENRSTMTIKNGSVVNGAVATSSNAINPGTINVENATYAVTGQFSGAAEGTGTLVIKKGATVSVGSIVDNANIVIDATGMNVSDSINFTGNLSKFTGTVEVINNSTLEAKIVDGKIVLSEKPVASVNGIEYTTIADAIAAAQAGETVTIIAGEYTTDITVNKAITVVGETDATGKNLVNITGRVSVSTGATVKNLNVHNEKTGDYDCAISINGKDIVIDGVKLTGYNGMRNCYAKGDVTIKNSTINASYFAVHFDGSDGGKVVIDNCNITGWVSYGGGMDSVTLKKSTFNAGSYAGQRSYADKLVIEESTFEVGYKLDIAVAKSEVTVTESKMADGSDIIELFNKEDAVSNSVTIDGSKITYVAKIGNTYYETLEEAIAAVTDYTLIELVADATLDYGAREAYGRDTTTDIIIDGQGFTLTLNQTNSDWSSIGMKNANGKLTLKNMTIEKTGYGDTSGAWNTHAIIFSCNVEMKDVTVNNSVAVQNGATLNNVTINEANGYYGLWINGNGQTVTMKGGEINATNGGRGIKVADQYISAPASVNLKVDGTKFNTAKKAAVLVSSTAGANITASGVDITNVAADSTNFVHVDEDWGAYNTNVTVTGATKAQEAVETFVATVGGNYYKTLQAALAAAKDGDTVVLLKNISVGWADVVKTSDNFTVIFKVEGKSITLDMNGKTISVVHESTTDRIYSVICVEDGASLTVNGNGSIDVTTHENTPKVAYMFWKRGTTGILTIENGTYHMNNSEDSMVYTNGDHIVKVKGGSWTLDKIATRVNEFPCIFNTYGNGANSIDVSGGTYNFNVSLQYWAHEVDIVDASGNLSYVINNNNGTWTASGEAAEAAVVTDVVGNYDMEVGYATLKDAIAAAKTGETVVLLSDITANGTITIDKSIKLDLNGKTISGTHGTEYSMIHVLNGAELTIVGDGKISYAAGGNNIGAAIWVEGKLTQESGTIEITGTWTLGFNVDLRPNAWGTAHTTGASFTMNGGKIVSTDTAVRVASNSSDAYDELGVTFTMNGGTIESTHDAIFVQHLYKGDLDVKVVSGTVSGNNSVIRIYGDAGSDVDIDVAGGKFTGVIKVADGYKNTDAIEIAGGTYSNEVSEDFCANGYIPTKNADGTYGVKVGKFVARVNGVGYETIADAIAAAQNGETVDLLGNSFENVASFNPNGITIKNGSISFGKTERIRVSGNVVFDNVDVTFDMDGMSGYPNSAIYVGNGRNTSITLTNGTNLLIKNPGYTAIYNDSVAYPFNIDNSTLTIEDQGGTTGFNTTNITLTNGAKLTTTNTGIAINGGSLNVDGTSVVTVNGTDSHGITNTVLTVAAGGKVDVDNCAFLGLNIKDGSSIAEGATVTVDNCGTSGNYVGIPARMNGTISGFDNILVDNAKIVAQGASGNAFNSIEAAIKAAKAGETVTILAGEYTTSITVNKAITVVGETDANGNNLVKINGGISITADGATVKNITASNPATTGYNCTLSINAKNVLVEGCEITDTNAMRYSYTSGTVTFKKCKLTATGTWVIHFDGNNGGDVIVENCEVNGWIGIGGGINVTLKDSKFYNGNWSGGNLYGDSITIEGCEFNNGFKLGIVSDAADVTVSNSTMTNGNIEDLFYDEDIASSDITVDGTKLVRVAKIGNTYYETLEEAIEAVTDWTTIKLVGNATLDYGAREAYGRDTTTDIIIDGQGFTLTLNQTNSDWSSIGMKNADGKLTLKDMTIEKTGYGDTSGAWNTHAIIFSCNVEMNDVTVNNSVAVQNGATLNNVTIKEANGYYGLWINGNGQTVTMNGGAINATNGGRGIKIADQYISAPASVTLTVNGTKFNTAKKAAVLVSSTAGANITASGVDVTNVAADTTNFVHVDEDWGAYNTNVTVTGATKAQEAAESFAATVNGNYYKTLQAALAAAKDGDTVKLIWANGNAPIAMNGSVYGKTVIITGTATVDWSKGFLFVGRGGAGDGTVIFEDAVLTSASDNASTGIHVSGREKNTTNKYDGTLIINNSTIELDYLINKGDITLNNSTLTVKNGFSIGGRPASETESGEDATATITLNNGSKVVVNNHNGMGLGYEAIGVMNIDATSTFETTQSFLVTAKGTMNVAGKVVIAETLTNNGKIVLTDVGATLTSSKCDNVTTTVADHKVVYENGTYKVVARVYVVEIVNGAKYESLADAIKAAKNGDTIKFLKDITEDVSINKDLTIAGDGHKYTGNISVNGKTVDVLIKNVNFVGGDVYAVTTDTINSITVENCTISNYGYGFLYAKRSTPTVVVKNVTVTDCNYGFHFVYGSTATLEDVEMIDVEYGLYVQNFAPKTVTIKNSVITSISIWEKAGNSAVQTFMFEGANTVGSLSASQYAKQILAKTDATLTAPEGANVTSGVEGYLVEYSNGKYSMIKAVAQNTTTGVYYKTLEAALEAAKGEEEIVIKLMDDATLDITAWQTLAIGGDTTKTITINGNGNTLTFNKLNSDWNNIATNNDAKLILNNMTITDSGKNNGPWNRYDLNFACDVELNNVKATKALAFKADATLNNVEINETGDNYAIWIQPNGQKVAIDGLTVTSAGRGIKIDQQYVDAPAKVELTVKDATFTTEKKAAILVKSTAGAEIDLTNVNISNVKADTVNAVWNDSDAGENYSKITVTGGNLAQEDVDSFVATVNDNYYKTLADAIAAAKDGETVTLLAPIVVEAGETVELDLAGKTIVMVTADDKTTSMILNKGNLTITDSVGGGKLSYHYTGNNSGDAYNTIESAPGSVLTIKGGTVENLSECLIAYAVDGLTNGGAGDVIVNIEGGTLTSKKIAVRIFANSTTNTGTLNISGGKIFGRVIIQNANANANKATLNITGGEFNTNGYKTDVLYVGGSAGATGAINATVTGGTFFGEILSSINKGFIAGGTYSNEVSEDFCADGYIPTKNADGTYGVKVGEFVARVNGVGYETIADAIAAAQDGETVTILAGTHNEVVYVNRLNNNITIKGADNFETILTGGIVIGVDDATHETGSVTVEGIYFQGQGLVLDELTKVTVNGNKFSSITNNAAIKINADNYTDTIVISGNEIDGVSSNSGIRIRAGKNVTITGNKVDNTCDNSILLESSSSANNGSVVISGNILSNWAMSDKHEGRAIRISNGTGDAAKNITVENNVMIADANATEEYAKITGASSATISVDKNYWDGKNPIDAGVINVAAYPNNYYTDKELQNLVLTTYAAQIGDKKYATFADAIAAAKDGDTIVLLADATSNGDMIGREKAVKITVNLGGYTLTSGHRVVTVYRKGTVVTFINGTLSGNTTGGSLMVSSGTKVIIGNNVTIKAAAKADAIQLDGGELLIDGDNVVVEGGINCLETSGSTSNKIVINGGTFNGNIIINDRSTCSITGGTFTVDVSKWCAEGYTCKKNDEGKYVVTTANSIKSINLSLEGNIGFIIGYYLTDDVLAANSGYKVQFLINDEVVKEMAASEGEKLDQLNELGANVRYRIDLTSVQMGQVVTVQLVNSDGETVAYCQGKESVRSYAEWIIANYAENEKLVELMKSMLTYGAYSQILFGKNLNEPACDVPEVQGVDIDDIQNITKDGSVTGVTIAGYSLVLESETTIKIYFSIADDISGYTFKCNGRTVEPVSSSKGLYYVAVENIGAPYLDTRYTISVEKGTEKLSVTCSALNYVKTVITDNLADEVDLQNMSKALYWYNKAANAYYNR